MDRLQKTHKIIVLTSYMTYKSQNMNMILLTTRWVYFDVDGNGIKGLKSVFRRYLRSVCVYGALEQAERKSDTRAEKKTTSARSASVSSSSSALSVDVWGGLSPPVTNCEFRGAKIWPKTLSQFFESKGFFFVNGSVYSRKCCFSKSFAEVRVTSKKKRDIKVAINTQFI